MSCSSSPALRSLQISSDGRTLIGRSPLIDGKCSPATSSTIKKQHHRLTPASSTKTANVVRSLKKCSPYFDGENFVDEKSPIAVIESKGENDVNKLPIAVVESKDESNDDKNNDSPPIISKSIDQGQTTELSLSPKLFTSEKAMLEILFASGPKIYDEAAGRWRPYWESRAIESRARLNEVRTEETDLRDEIERLREEEVRLRRELDEYKEYMELRDLTEIVSDEE